MAENPGNNYRCSAKIVNTMLMVLELRWKPKSAPPDAC